MGKPIIRLWQTDSLGLIILMKTGVVVSNQTGGNECMQPEAHELEHFFSFESGSVGYFALNERMADYIDGFLAKDGNTRFLKVDRARLEESYEAWVFVEILAAEGDPGATLISGFRATKGILTWPNSD